MWAAGAKKESLDFLRQFTASLMRDLDSEPPDQQNNPVAKQKIEELTHLLARCCYKQGEWQMATKDEWSSVSTDTGIGHYFHSPNVQRNIKDILRSFVLATHYDSQWYKAWHTWALANFEVVNFLESQTENKLVDGPGNDLVVHVVQAVDGT